VIFGPVPSRQWCADCGKPSCHCAKPDDPGHDPQFRLTRRVAGKSTTESFPNPSALRKAQQEVAEFHRLQKLSEDLVSVNEKICALRPVERERGGGRIRKTNGCCDPSGNGARSKSVVGRIFAERENSGGTDLETIEGALRASLHEAGTAALRELLQFEAPPPDQRQLPCSCGHQAQYIVMKVSFPPTSHWTSKTQTFPRGCDACKPWSDKRRLRSWP
jgi:hypothetical protein